MTNRKLTWTKKAALVTVLTALITALHSQIPKTISPAPLDYNAYLWMIDTFNNEHFHQLF